LLKESNENSDTVTAIWNRALCCGIGLSGIRAYVEKKYVPCKYARQYTGEAEAEKHFP